MEREQGVTVGVEIGGVQTTLALIDLQGHVHYRYDTRTLRGRPAVATLEPYLRAIDVILEQARTRDWPVRGIGVSIPGSVDAQSRRPLVVPSLPSLNNFPLCDLLENRYHVPTAVHADVDAAVLCEYYFGAGKKYRRLLFLTVNAVVGAAFAIDGQLEHSVMPYVGHVCHVPISASGPRCSCGKYGCINTLVSIDAMQRMIQRALRRGEETSLIQRFSNQHRFSHQVLAEEAARGDNLALQIYREIGRWLSAAMTKYMGLFEPNVFILGGGLLHGGDLLLAPLRSALEKDQDAKVCSMVEVIPACMGRDGALVGSVVPLF